MERVRHTRNMAHRPSDLISKPVVGTQIRNGNGVDNSRLSSGADSFKIPNHPSKHVRQTSGFERCAKYILSNGAERGRDAAAARIEEKTVPTKAPHDGLPGCH